MSTSSPVDSISRSGTKKKRKSKKKANGSVHMLTKASEQNGVKAEEVEEDEVDDDGTSEPVKTPVMEHAEAEDALHMPSTPPQPPDSVEEGEGGEGLGLLNGTPRELEEPIADTPTPVREERREETENGETPSTPISLPTATDATSRFDAMQQERDNLLAEVAQLRQSLESLQERHDEDLSNLREELETSNRGKERAELQHRNLLDRVQQIRSQLGERLKEDAEELAQAKEKIEELERGNTGLEEENSKLQEKMSNLNSDLESQATEIQSLRSRTTLSASNWAKERDDLAAREASIREEYEVARLAMSDWEILATEERARRETLEERVQELEEQLSNQQEAYARVKDEAETQGNTVDGLQRALRDMQEERGRELRELVEQSDSQLDDLRKQAKDAEDFSADLASQLAATQIEVERALPFEKEVKEKNLLIGKLRHEAVILNDHLTKALRFLRRGKPEDNVDRQLVTNHFLQFLALDRSDPKKFQILQLIAALLAWTDEQKEQAGLLRQGSWGDMLRVPVSPFRRTPSTPSLSTDYMGDPQSATVGKESLAELWSEFLEREAEAGVVPSGPASARRASHHKHVRSPSLASVGSPSMTGTFPRSFTGLRRMESSQKGSLPFSPPPDTA